MTTDFLGGEAEGASSLGSQVSFVQETQLTPETFASQELSKMAVAQVPLHIYDSPLGKEWDIDELSLSPNLEEITMFEEHSLSESILKPCKAELRGTTVGNDSGNETLTPDRATDSHRFKQSSLTELDTHSPTVHLPHNNSQQAVKKETSEIAIQCTLDICKQMATEKCLNVPSAKKIKNVLFGDFQQSSSPFDI